MSVLLAAMGFVFAAMLASIYRNGYTQALLRLNTLYALAALIRATIDLPLMASLKPIGYVLPEVLWFTYGPAYWHFAQYFLQGAQAHSKHTSWHWKLPLLLYILWILFHINDSTQAFEEFLHTRTPWLAMAGVGIFAWLYSLRCWWQVQTLLASLSNLKEKSANRQRRELIKQLQWVYLPVLGCGAITLALGSAKYLFQVDISEWVINGAADLIWGLLGLPVLWMQYYTLKYPSIFKWQAIDKPKSTQEKSVLISTQLVNSEKLIPKETILDIEEQFQQKKLFLHPDLTIKSAADALEINPQQLSKVLREQYNKGFNDYVNSCRIQYFIGLVGKVPEGARVNIGELFLNSGFKSKATFNRAFKKAIGSTPREYLRERRI